MFLGTEKGQCKNMNHFEALIISEVKKSVPYKGLLQNRLKCHRIVCLRPWAIFQKKMQNC